VSLCGLQDAWLCVSCSAVLCCQQECALAWLLATGHTAAFSSTANYLHCCNQQRPTELDHYTAELDLPYTMVLGTRYHTTQQRSELIQLNKTPRTWCSTPQLCVMLLSPKSVAIVLYYVCFYYPLFESGLQALHRVPQPARTVVVEVPLQISVADICNIQCQQPACNSARMMT
jgi:hypothetical protein